MWVFWVASLVHLTWGITLIVSDAPMLVTGLYFLGLLVPNHLMLGSGMLIVACLGFLGATRRFVGFWGAFCLTPQQITLLISAFSALTFIVQGHYADGVERPITFILPDQALVVVTAMVHTCALLSYYRANLWRHVEAEIVTPVGGS